MFPKKVFRTIETVTTCKQKSMYVGIFLQVAYNIPELDVCHPQVGSIYFGPLCTVHNITNTDLSLP